MTGRMFKTLMASFGDMQPSASRLAGRLIRDALTAMFLKDGPLRDRLDVMDKALAIFKQEEGAKRKKSHARK